MLFTSPLFIFIFLPLVVSLHFLIPNLKVRNFFLVLASILFYIWGELQYSWILMLLITNAFLIALLIESRTKQKGKKFLAIGLLINFLFLIYFKYTDFIISNINSSLKILGITYSLAPLQIPLPLGISFFTFHCASYLIDVYRKEIKYEKNFIDFTLYNVLFPHLIAGPIVRYKEISHEIKARINSINNISIGSYRFIIGLSKKMLIANSLGKVADYIFAMPQAELTFQVSWVGIICYSLQLYYDFSGYSDMAIGLGRMFGFIFPENFNYPYQASTIQDFWQKWHMSLSRWFRDYLYIPLGGNRHGKIKTYRNLFTVFILCGLWHGASLNFLIWGLIHGLFLAIERTNFSYYLQMLWLPLRHLYTLLIIIIGWVFFRSDTLYQAYYYLKVMFALEQSKISSFYNLSYFLDREILFILVLSIIGCIYWKNLNIYTQWLKLEDNYIIQNLRILKVAKSLVLISFSLLLFSLSIIEIFSTTHNPFIYFRF
ncbi:MBOAT family O-acyltransferase [Rickettsia endosymbiont of Halotydeus destructor]|uniref:MBOAT family O-acyltransferase n=1 Tax=Rickettsia endosymbiont of Halotydeus destructor TaxID=2996754 RepID=UPI003BAECC8F